MIILRAIGNFFVRIGRWIRDTAWVQPLLIVGGIFAIIFSIPHIVNWIQSWSAEGNLSHEYYDARKIAIDNGETDPDNEASRYLGQDSSVDKFLTYIENNDSDSIQKEYGERFFLVFIDENSGSDIYKGFEKFNDSWNNREFNLFTGEEEKYNLNKNGTFKIHTIFVDQTTDDGDNYFDSIWLHHIDLFEKLVAGYENSPYAKNQNWDENTFSYFYEPGSDIDTPSITTPSILYFDYAVGNSEWTGEYAGLSDILLNVSGSSDIDKARTLYQCWTHQEDFIKLKND